MNNYVFRCDSDALIVKGLLSLLCKIFSGHGSKEIQSIDHSKILDLIGLSGAISVQRTNGFASAVDKIHKISV
jgi:cysteine desulfuration protein SufE